LYLFVWYNKKCKDYFVDERKKSMSKIPYLEGKGKNTTLYVDGKPFVALSGEIHNSSSSSLEYMDNVVWPALRPLNMNCVIMPVYWECVEPEEGVFDFTLVDGLIDQARRENMRIVFLWFGLWKNGMSTYVPGWVKNDSKKYFRVRKGGSQAASARLLPESGSSAVIDCISPLCVAAYEADARAYRELMRHIREYDSEQNTVIVMQVENEIGVLGSSRDYSDYANSVFNSEIPPEVAAEYGVKGNWAEAFGIDADEYFMAYHYAKAIEHIVKEGKEEYPLPMYVNAWLEQFPEITGNYPSGGPIAKMMRLWRLVAPSVDFYAPDIYVDNYRDVCDEYATDGNPLFIPEVRSTEDATPFLFYAIGQHNALCFAPFGIEDLFASSSGANAEVLQMLNIDPASMADRKSPAGPMLAKAYQMISNMSEVIRDAHKNNKIHAFLEQNEPGKIIELEKYYIKVTYTGAGGSFFMRQPQKQPGTPVAGGFIIELSPDEFVVVGVSSRIEVLPKLNDGCAVGLERKEEGQYIDNKWVRGRILNGDEG